MQSKYSLLPLIPARMIWGLDLVSKFAYATRKMADEKESTSAPLSPSVLGGEDPEDPVQLSKFLYSQGHISPFSLTYIQSLIINLS